MKKFTSQSVSLLIALILAAQGALLPVAFAQTGDVSGSGNAVYCRNGARDYGNFLSSVVSYNGFVEYWKDILVRYNANMCVYLDIDNLLNRIEKARTQIRKAFYVCDASAPKLARTYHELEAELLFLRGYVDFNEGNVIFVSQEKLKTEFKDLYVREKNFFTDEEAEALFAKFLSKYEARKDAYVNCEDPTWGNLIVKWKEFKENLGGFAAVKDAAETINKRWDSVVNTPFKRTGGFLGGLLDVKLNSIEPEKAWADIAGELQKNSPSGFTFDQLQAATSSDAERFDQELSRTEYLVQYQQQYQESTASIIKEIIDRVNALQSIIQGTYGFIDQTAQCTKGILDKTCS